MSHIVIRELRKEEDIPFDLLMLADPSRDAINDYVKRGISFCAFIDEVIVGISVIIKTRPFIFELVNIAVNESYQGKGVGKKLIVHSINEVKEMGGKTLEVGTGNSSINQLALYQKCGFRITGVDRDFFRKHYDEKIFENGIECRDMIRLSLEF